MTHPNSISQRETSGSDAAIRSWNAKCLHFRTVPTRVTFFTISQVLNPTANSVQVDQYIEIVRESDIDRHLDTLSLQKSDGVDLFARWNLSPFCTITTTRTKLSIVDQPATVDLDETDFGYRVGEIEVMLEEGGDREEASRLIERICTEHGLETSSVPGKVLKYIEDRNPQLYALWKQCGLLQSKKISG
ncbi:thiamine-triphosphatase-like [Planoprotostelium fungivorum]|uniref:Thiamine-triphosphatase-like n=1 Tax=Planoprotostelium fungivorum TaxID=1890364 RepID=A0A2P6NQ53_9EUKA|nr:thiamine-triphosphatase-like [Planoprotostelium fungivorum]